MKNYTRLTWGAPPGRSEAGGDYYPCRVVVTADRGLGLYYTRTLHMYICIYLVYACRVCMYLHTYVLRSVS